MRSFRLTHSGAGISGLREADDPVPQPGAGEALVAMRASSISYRDLMILRGDYVLPVKDNVVLGCKGWASSSQSGTTSSRWR